MLRFSGCGGRRRSASWCGQRRRGARSPANCRCSSSSIGPTSRGSPASPIARRGMGTILRPSPAPVPNWRRLSIPSDYLLAIEEALGDKPVLVTAIEARMETDDRFVTIEQALLVKRLLQLCYWLDASLVAYPNVAADAKSDRAALLVNETARPSL